jgi:putative transposase
MSHYRRVKLSGGTYFFTVNLMDRRAKTLTDNIDLLRNAYANMRRKHPFHCDAIVILPDHLHAVWTLPAGDCDYSKRLQLFKAGFSRYLPSAPSRSHSKRKKREKGIWQRRFWEHLIHDDDDYRFHLQYCRDNPVKHGLVDVAQDWPYSSIHMQEGVGGVGWA